MCICIYVSFQQVSFIFSVDKGGNGIFPWGSIMVLPRLFNITHAFTKLTYTMHMYNQYICTMHIIHKHNICMYIRKQFLLWFCIPLNRHRQNSIATSKTVFPQNFLFCCYIFVTFYTLNLICPVHGGAALFKFITWESTWDILFENKMSLADKNKFCVLYWQ